MLRQKRTTTLDIVEVVLSRVIQYLAYFRGIKHKCFYHLRETRSKR